MPLGMPPSDGLDQFPRRALDGQLHRIHLERDPATGELREPWWFASTEPHDAGEGGRFDLQPPAGTCYLAESLIGAALEVFPSHMGLVPSSALRRRRGIEITVPDDAPHAGDFTAVAARGFGVNAEIHSTPVRPVTRAWAEALFAAGWRALRTFIRHDPAQREAAVALLEPLGGSHPPTCGSSWTGRTFPLHGDEALADELARFGIEIVPGDLENPDIIDAHDAFEPG